VTCLNQMQNKIVEISTVTDSNILHLRVGQIKVVKY